MNLGSGVRLIRGLIFFVEKEVHTLSISRIFGLECACQFFRFYLGRVGIDVKITIENGL